MAEVIAKVGVKREPGFLYFINKKGHVARVEMARGRQTTKKKPKQEVIAKVGIEKEAGYLYFLNKKGDVSRALLARN